MQLVREIYPLSNIIVVTNGILCRNMDAELLDYMRSLNIVMDISCYPPMMNQMEAVVEFLIGKGIKVRFTNPITKFKYPLDSQWGHAKFAERIYCNCPNLYKGKLYVCPIMAYIPYFNAYFGQHLDNSDGSIDIYEEGLTFDQLKSELKRVRHLCDICLYISTEHNHEQEWQQGKIPALEDYVYPRYESSDR